MFWVKVVLDGAGGSCREWVPRSGGDLTRRVPETDPATEPGRLGAALNDMLTKIEDAFTQEKPQASGSRSLSPL